MLFFSFVHNEESETMKQEVGHWDVIKMGRYTLKIGLVLGCGQ